MKIPRAPSQAEETFALQLKALKIPFDREKRFHVTRLWRWDFAFIDYGLKLAVEIEGLTAAGGRHQRLSGRTKDIEKHNSGVLAGWTVLYATPKHVRSGELLEWVQLALGMT